MKKILILEDEANIRSFVVINLKRAGYDVLEAETGRQALELLKENPDVRVAILDIMLPDIDGFEVCRTIRASNTTIGIIMLTARTQEMDKVTGLMIGADDYVPKPFSPSELVARVDSLARRINGGEARFSEPQRAVSSGRFTLDLRSRALEKGGESIELTQIEFQIMKYFLENKNKAVSRDEMLAAVWGEDYFGDAKIVDVNLHRLRLKIEDNPAAPVHLVAIRGFGYKWVE